MMKAGKTGSERVAGAMFLTLRMEEGVRSQGLGRPSEAEEERKQTLLLEAIEKMLLCEQLEVSSVKPILHLQNIR